MTNKFISDIVGVIILAAIYSTIVTIIEFIYIKIKLIIKNKKGDHNG